MTHLLRISIVIEYPANPEHYPDCDGDPVKMAAYDPHMGLPRVNSLWARKDTRRPGVVRVLDVNGPPGWMESGIIEVANIVTGRVSEVSVESFPKRYIPFVGEGGSTQESSDDTEKAA